LGAEAAALEAQIAAFMRGEGGDFEALALALWALQVRENIDYQAFCRDLPAPERWWQIPAVPVTLFRDLPLTKGDPAAAAVTFRTSGTTGPRGVVRLRDTALYDLGARLQATAVAGPIPTWGSSLVPHAPDSSLGHMCLDLSPGLRPRFDLVEGVDVDGVLADIEEATREGRPMFLPGTAFAFAALIGALSPEAPPFALPAGSVLMITGGFKGRVVQLGAEELRARLDALFPGCRRVEEYGMSELSSQLWAPELRAPFSPPPWLGVQPVDPWTGAPAEVGLLRFVDLASLHTVVAIETRDLGRRLPDGRVELLGRLPGEHPRGCSLSVEEALGRAAASALFTAAAAEGTEATSSAPFSVEYVQAATPPAGPYQLPAEGGGARVHLHDTWSGDRFTVEALRERARFRLGHSHEAHAHGGEPAPPPLSRADAPQVAAVLAGLARLRGEDAGPLSQGLSPAAAAAALAEAINAITEAGLARELATPGERPGRVVIVVAYGVFTSPIEWTALLLAAGCAVHLKAPARDPALCAALCAAFAAEGLPIAWSADRALPPAERVLAFGGDPSVASVAAASGVPTVQHGHRISLGLTDGDPGLAHAWAWDAAWYDTRGCLAPTALFCLGDPDPLVEALHEAMGVAALAMPRGVVDGGLGPEWRRRVGLAKRLGRALEGPEHAVLLLPADRFVPIALPRMIVVHAIPDGQALDRLLRPWRAHLSTLVTDDWLRFWRDPAAWWSVYTAFPRLAHAGGAQRPPFPRRHDGLPMLGSLLMGGPTG